VVPDATVTDGQRAGIRSGIALWNERARTRLTLESMTAMPELAIQFQRAAAPFHGYYDAQRATVFINEDLRDAAQSIVIAHEIGHAFALAHVSQRPSVMASGNLDTEPTAEDVETLAGLWGPCAPADGSE
jgi:Zn-dependent peptidase ImmA (M78 family)